MKGEVNSTIIVGDFNTPLILMDRSSRPKNSKVTQALSNKMDQLDLIDIYRYFTQKQWISPFSQVYMEHSPGQITSCATNLALVNLKKLK